MFGKKSNLIKIICDDRHNKKSLTIMVQCNRQGSIIDMNPRVNDTLNVFYGNQISDSKISEIQKYIEFQLADKTDINFNFVTPTIIYHKQNKVIE